MSKDKPKEAEPDYKQLWRNFGTYRKDATARYEKQAGIARAKMAQQGIQEGSEAWNTRMGDVEKAYQSDMREIYGGYTGKTIRKHFKKQMRMRHFNLADAREYAKLDPAELEQKIESTKATLKKHSTMDWEDQHQMGNITSKFGAQRDLAAMSAARDTDYLDAYERYQKSGGADWMPMAEKILGARYGEGKQTFGKQSKEEEAMEKAKAAAGGQTSDAGMGQSAAMMAEQENKFKTVNPWI